ncbi:phytoene/squalene synthase family protein [Leucobacter luti]|uniref:Phytoene/squalene synthetase n=1 Tax=Leucobacter luti TaxID=340320 RepID=A0A4Q7TG42_9MICO|nr:squalene/phytoene synthase family protein [Leucobacter luti]MBL3699660.1 phytoene synthase [Leucobacter luti]RZT59434.1 phytoene/squalene synthetase [Leucobacter luti]
MRRRTPGCNALDDYREACEQAADQVIRVYSTSFGAATRLLGTRHRRHVRNIYALARIADELVDGVASGAGLSLAEQHERLSALEAETERALDTGYSSNPIVHAFACSARLSGIGADLTVPFFASMRTDLQVVPARGDATPATSGERAGVLAATPSGTLHGFDSEAHRSYVYGSAEVIGLMCLRVFVRDSALSPGELARLERGARSLGAAFQNVNFLRDLAEDTQQLSRSYLSADAQITEAVKDRWIATIRAELAEAEEVIPMLPRDARRAVDCARRLFARLTDRIDQTPVTELLAHRVRVSGAEKTLLVIKSVAGAGSRSAA